MKSKSNVDKPVLKKASTATPTRSVQDLTNEVQALTEAVGNLSRRMREVAEWINAEVERSVGEYNPRVYYDELLRLLLERLPTKERAQLLEQASMKLRGDLEADGLEAEDAKTEAQQIEQEFWT